jgi:hypothetical protein
VLSLAQLGTIRGRRFDVKWGKCGGTRGASSLTTQRCVINDTAMLPVLLVNISKRGLHNGSARRALTQSSRSLTITCRGTHRAMLVVSAV